MSSSRALGFSTINGLPAHVLLVHLVVIFVPLSAFALVASLKATIARRLGWWLPALSAIALASVFAAMNAGGWLQNHVENTALVRDHTKIAGQLWPFSVVVLLLSVVVWWFNGRDVEAGGAPTRERSAVSGRASVAGGATTTIVVGVLAVLVAVGSIVQVARIGDSGARASWQGHFSKTSIQSSHGG